MDLEQIGYFLYMEEQEKKAQLKVNAESESDLVGVESKTNEEKIFSNKKSENIAPTL